MDDSKWEQYYKKNPLKKIPWQKIQADYFVEVIESDMIKSGSVLDLGCGTGVKSIYLAKKGFQVTGIDISKTAIKFAKENSKRAKVKAKFLVADATDLSFLKNKKFDFILDWANFHGIVENKRVRYIKEIVKHTKKGSLILLRCFEKNKTQKNFVVRPMGPIYLFSKKDIKNLFGKYFKILDTNRSKSPGKSSPSRWLGEYLMERS